MGKYAIIPGHGAVKVRSTYYTTIPGRGRVKMTATASSGQTYQEKIREEVNATGNKWAIENFHATHD